MPRVREGCGVQALALLVSLRVRSRNVLVYCATTSISCHWIYSQTSLRRLKSLNLSLQSLVDHGRQMSDSSMKAEAGSERIWPGGGTSRTWGAGINLTWNCHIWNTIESPLILRIFEPKHGFVPGSLSLSSFPRISSILYTLVASSVVTYTRI